MIYFPYRNRLVVKVLLIFTGLIFQISVLHEVIISFQNSERLSLVIKSDQQVSTNNSIRPSIRNSMSTSEEDDEDEEWELDNENVPKLNLLLGKSENGPSGRHSSNCSKFPDLYTVRFSNVHWQIQQTDAEMHYLYSAYLDIRGNESSLIRVLGMSDKISLNEKNSTLKACQFWFEHRQKPVFGNITEVKMTWMARWGRVARYFPYLIACQLPANLTEMPVSVSLVPSQCSNATNNLNILHRDRALSNSTRIPTKDVAVCVKALDFPNIKMRDKLVEWIETLRLLGADKIFFYEYFVDSSIKRILDHYESQDIISVTQTTLPGELPNQSQLRHLYIQAKRTDKRLTELVPYNDCFYRNMYDYKYIAVLDTDELIMPVDNINWSELLQGLTALQKWPSTTFCFQNFYFLDSMLTDEREDEVSHISPQFHMLRHVYRISNSTGKKYMKCFHSTEQTLAVHNHLPFFCEGERKRCKLHFVDESRAQLNHYRATCVSEIMKNCSAYLADAVRDTKIWRFQDQITSRVQSVLNNVRS